MTYFTEFYGVKCFLLLSIGVFCSSRAFDLEKHLIFRLYTLKLRDEFHALNAFNAPFISANLFDPKRPTRIFVHGFLSSEHVLIRYKEAFLKLGDYNFIGVDWIHGARTFNYFLAKSRVQAISEKLAALLDALVTLGLNLRDVTIVGHSLGAHIAGRAAKQLKSFDKIGCIIGLDPASVRFDFFDREKRLADSDAEYVEIIHTDSDKFGFSKPLGHVDYYPNYGKKQPGCPLRNRITNLVEKCSHIRAHHLYLESLSNEFPAIQCKSHEEIQKYNQCTFNNVTAVMGGDITPTTPKAYGIFYLETMINHLIVYPIIEISNALKLFHIIFDH